MCGWIKIDRSLTDWEWLSKPEMVQLLVYLLLKATVENRKWQGIDIKRGQLVTSVATICADLNMSTKKARTCLERLKQSETINISTTNRFSLITICNYESYQDQTQDEGQTKGKPIGKQLGKQRANITTCNYVSYQDQNAYRGKQRASQSATSKEYNNINIINNNDDDNNACVCVREEDFKTELMKEQAWLEVMAKNYGLPSTDAVADWMDKFDTNNKCRDYKHTNLSDYRRHFNDWLRIQIRELKKNQNEQNSKNRRVGSEPSQSTADYFSSF